MKYCKITPQMLLGFSGESSSSGSCEGKQARQYLKSISTKIKTYEPEILSAQKMNETIKGLEEFENKSEAYSHDGVYSEQS